MAAHAKREHIGSDSSWVELTSRDATCTSIARLVGGRLGRDLRTGNSLSHPQALSAERLGTKAVERIRSLEAPGSSSSNRARRLHLGIAPSGRGGCRASLLSSRRHPPHSCARTDTFP